MAPADRSREGEQLFGGEPFSWTVVSRDGEAMRVELRGEVELGLEGITRINSCGVREWVNFVRGLDAVRALWFSRCSPVVVLQLNTIYNFRGRAHVTSFMAPYVCEACHSDEYKLLDVAEHFPDRRAHVPAFRCRRCGGVMVFDELPERYLSFLSEVELVDPSSGQAGA